MKKKLMALLLAGMLATGMAVGPVGTETVLADEGGEAKTYISKDNCWQYRMNDDASGIIITKHYGYFDPERTELTGWGTIDGKTVTGIEGTVDLYGYLYEGVFSSLLTHIEIPSSVTSIGVGAFSGCSGLRDIEIPSSVTSIGAGAFSGCSGLMHIEIPAGVTSIEKDTFRNCSGLTSIGIPSSVTSIGAGAFSACSGLRDIEIPVSVRSIDKDAVSSGTVIWYSGSRAQWNSVYGAGDIASMGVSVHCADDTENPIYMSQDGCWRYRVNDDASGIIIICYHPSPFLPSPAPGGIELTGWGTIDGKTVTGIQAGMIYENAVTPVGGAFGGQYSLGSVEIPSSVTSIGAGAFSMCSYLRNIEIPAGVTSIEQDTFRECSSLTSVKLPSGVASIGNGAFRDCSNLTSIEIGGVTSIGNGAFANCSNLTSIEIGGVTSIGNGAFANCSSLTSVKMPASATSIGEAAFDGCRGLTSIEIPVGVTSIERYTFKACHGLTSIEIPSSVTSIGEKAFDSCIGLTSIEIPSSVTSIGFAAFRNCWNLKSIKIPVSVTSIDMYAIPDCADIWYSGSRAQWNSISGAGDVSCEFRIHCADDTSATPGQGEEDSAQKSEDSEKSDQIITAKNITKTYGEKPFYLNAKADTGTALTYVVSNKKIATIDKKGKITIKGCGITEITITAPGSDTYNQATKTIKLTVKPKKAALSSVKSKKKGTATVKWKQDKTASGYLVVCATDKKFKKNKVQITVGRNKTVSATVKKLKPGKTYYVRICAYAKSGKTKVQGDWSKVKTVKIKR